jgi:hypothetical protein
VAVPAAALQRTAEGADAEGTDAESERKCRRCRRGRRGGCGRGGAAADQVPRADDGDEDTPLRRGGCRTEEGRPGAADGITTRRDDAPLSPAKLAKLAKLARRPSCRRGWKPSRWCGRALGAVAAAGDAVTRLQLQWRCRAGDGQEAVAAEAAGPLTTRSTMSCSCCVSSPRVDAGCHRRPKAGTPGGRPAHLSWWRACDQRFAEPRVRGNWFEED